MVAAFLATAAVLVAAAAGPAASGAPPGAARDLAQVYFSNTLTRAEVISVVGGAVHDYRIDEGRVIAVRPNANQPSAIDLLERDGTRQTIAVGQSTRIVGVGRLFGPSIARGVRIVAVREGGGPAILIRPSGSARALGKIYLGTTLVRAEVLTYSARTLHDFRIDEGRIVSAKPSSSSIVLLERDGTKQTIAYSSSTQITEAGQPVDQTALTKGLFAITVRQGDGPAVEIRLFPQLLTAPR